MPIKAFLHNQPFDQDAIDNLSMVLVGVCERLGVADRADKVTEAVAKTIIELAQRGVRDTAMLRKMTLMEFNVVE
jgi:hypothetical protein